MRDTVGCERFAFAWAAALALAVLLPAGEARALNECGALASGAATCSDQAYANGIHYNVNTGWGGGVAGDVALTVTGGPATRITARPHNVLHWERGAIIIRTAPQGAGDATTRDIALTVGADGGAVAILNRSGADSDGVNIDQHGKAADSTTVTLGSGVTIGTENAPMTNGGVDLYITETSNTGDHGITSAATIHSTGNGIEVAAVGPGDFTITNTGSITVAATGGRSIDKNGILFWQWEHMRNPGELGGTRRTVDSATTITNAGSITVAAGQGTGIDAMAHGLGLYRIVNSGGGAQGITASGANGRGIYLDASHHTGAAGSRAIEVENSGRIATPGAGGRGIWVQTTGAGDGELQAAQHKGDVAIVNSGSISSASHAIFVDADMGAVSVTHSGGAIASTAADGIRVQQGGTGDAAIAVAGGATLTSKRAGIHADLSHADNADGQVKITQAGTITARTGVYAAVSRASAEGETRAATAGPAIDIAWTGSFTQAEAGNGGAGGAGPSPSHDEVPEAEIAMATRYGTAAGIEAHILSWREVAAQVAEGDDPGMFANAAAVTALFADGADADDKTRAAAAIASFRVQLTSDRGAIPDVNSVDADDDDTVTDAEITAYLSVDDADRRAFLRNILREHLSAAETAVLRAAVTNDGLDAALDAGGAVFSDDYKTAVKALLDRHNAGGIRVAVSAGGIDSGGDGIRAYYATPNAMNGAISVTVAAGATVEGDMAGIYVANAGATGSGADRTLKQTVTVDGTVTGGSGAGVHMAGGGRLIVGAKGRVGGGVLADGAGDLQATISGTVEGDVRSMGAGALRLAVPEGGVVTGTVHDPAGPLTVAGSIGRLLYAGGATVTVAATGALTGVEVDGRIEALRSEGGDLAVMVAGRVSGDVVGLGAGDHRVTVAEGGSVTGTVHLAASTVRVAGAAGRVWLERGGTVAVDASGRVTGVEGVGIRSETGDLTVTVAGVVMGDILALGSGEHTVSVAPGGRVTGTVRLATESAVALAGTAGRVVLERGGTVAIGEAGRVTGVDGVAIRSAGGELVVSLRQAAGETVSQAAGRVQGRIEEAGGTPQVLFRRAGEEEAVPLAGAPGSAVSVPVGAYDVGVVADGGGVRVAHAFAPRARVYEALPSVLLSVNDLAPGAGAGAARSSHGAWGEVEASRSSWDADRTTTGTSWDARRSGVRTGLDVAAGGGWSLGISAHHRRARADVDRGGRVEAEGSGVGLSAGFEREGFYADARGQASWYRVDLSSSGRGALASGLPGLGWSLGLEAGRRLALPGGMGAVSLTPRVGLVHSQLSLDDFTDAVGARVSPGTMRSLRGRAGVGVEVEAGAGSVLFGTLDVEREFRRRTRVTVSGTPLEARSEGSVVRVGAGGAHDWEGTTLRGAVSYATGGGDDYGGSLALVVRF